MKIVFPTNENSKIKTKLANLSASWSDNFKMSIINRHKIKHLFGSSSGWEY